MKLEQVESAFLMHYDRLFRFAFMYTDNYLDTQDVVMDVFLKYQRVDKRFDKPEDELAYLSRMVKNQCFDIKRRKTIEVPFDRVYEMQSDKRLDMLVVAKHIEKLPPKSKQTILLMLEGLGMKEIAKRLSVSISAACQNRKYAIKYLKQSLNV